LMGTSIATLGQALTSSVKISQKASNGTAQTIFTSGMKTVVGLSDSIFTALSKTEKKADYLFGADVAKLLGIIINGCLDFKDSMDFKNEHLYGHLVKTTSDTSTSLVQVKPDRKKLIASIALQFLGRAGALAVESTAAGLIGEESAKAEYVKKLTEAMTYLKDKATVYTQVEIDAVNTMDKQSLCHMKATVIPQIEKLLVEPKKTLATPIPEKATDAEKTALLTAKDQAQKDIKELQKKIAELNDAWSVYCDDDTEENKNYYSNKKKAAIHTLLTSSLSTLLPEIVSTVILCTKNWNPLAEEGGILLQSENANINQLAESTIGLHSQTGVFINTRQHDGAIVAQQVPPLKLLDAQEKIKDWGIKSAGTLAEVQNYASNAGLGVPQNKPDSFVVTDSEYVHVQSTWLKEVIAEVRSAEAKKHVISTADSNASVVIDGNADSHGIFLHAKSVAGAADVDSSVLLTHTDNRNVSTTVLLNDTGFALTNNREDKASITGQNANLTLMMGDGQNANGFIELTKDTLSLRGGKATLQMNNNGQIQLKPSGEGVAIDKVTIKGATITSSAGSLELGGEIKITAITNTIEAKFTALTNQNAKTSTDITALHKKLETLQKKLDEKADKPPQEK
ncbi:MAG: hypothetical protein RRY20_08345, partial [Bilophila sp.]